MTAVQLNSVAVSSSALLRAIHSGEWTNRAELARAAGRNPKNIARDLEIMVGAGLIEERSEAAHGKPIALSVEGTAQLAAIVRAESGQDEPGSSDTRFPEQIGDIRLIKHAQIFPDHGNARVDWDSDEAREELDALRADIVQFGLLQNLVVRPDSFGDALKVQDAAGKDLPLFTLVGGERRWRAIGLAIAEDDWPVDRPLPCRVLDTDDLGHRLAALSENLQRRNLNPLEKAKAFEGLAEAFAATGVAADKLNREIADRVGVTIEHVQQHRSFLKLDDKDQERLALAKDDARRLSISEARKLVARKAEAAAGPPELELHPIARLVLAEVMHLAATSGRYAYSDHEVGPAVFDDPFVADLVAADQLYTPRLDPYGDHAGRVVLRLGYGAAFAAFPWSRSTGEDHAEAVAAGLAEEQARFLAGTPGVERPDGTYLTPWLNGPFELTEDGQAIRRQVEAERAEAAAARAAREAADAERAVRWRAARDLHCRLFAVAQERPEAGRPQEVKAIAQDVDRPLPWSVNAGGDLLDANGKRIAPFGQWNGVTDQGLVTAQMIAAAVNATAGLATPVIVEEEDVDEPEQDIDGNDPDADDDVDTEADA